MSVRLHLFGSPKIDCGGTSFALPFERRSQLLVLLALKRSWVGRAELASMLWPEHAAKLANTNLRKTLFRLHSLPWADRIELQGNAFRLEAETDVFDFESALRENRIADALPLRRGELLAGFEDDQSEAWASWLSFERDRLRFAWRSAALSRLAAEIDPAEGADLSARLLDADPLDEAALRAHMLWLARNGQSARARQAYHEFVARLAEDLGLAPGAELKGLHDSLGTTSGPPVPTLATALPTPDTGFVGRSVELRRIAVLLAQDDCRLLCIVGPGGVGKTRLARRALQELAPGYSDGVAFVPLEDVSLVSEVSGRLAHEIGVGLAGSAEPLDQVIEFLRERHMLLVLDNFEHLVADASILDQLLQACARLKFIVTSRVRLAVAAEWSLPLEGLPCPELEDSDRVEAFDAVRLFVKAAQRVEPALVPSVEAASITDICQQVEGLPLALELAAAWTRVLSCDAIAAELRQGTELLRAVDPARPARHASIEVVFDQSWRLLTTIERDALSRLSVFRGGFSAEAARFVAEASLPVLGALADKSLLRRDGGRIHLHRLVHQLAAARLGDGPMRAAARAAHAAYFHQLLAQLRPAVDLGERSALQTVDTEFENCRLAWLWSIEQGKADALTRSVPTLLNFCDYRGRFEEGLALLRQAVESPLAHDDAPLRALMLSKAAHLEYRLDRYGDAEASASRALASVRRGRDQDTRVQALTVLACCSLRRGRLADAQRSFKQALEQTTAETHALRAAATLDNLALVEKTMGHYSESLRLSLESLVLHRRLGDSAGVALCLNNLGDLYLVKHEVEAAGAHLREGLAICDRDGLVATRVLILANLTEVALRTGDISAAEDFADRAAEAAEAVGNRAGLSWMKIQKARLAVRRGELGDARSMLASGLALAIALELLWVKAGAVLCFAEILAAQDEVSCACQVLAFASGHASISAPDRQELQAQLARWSGTPGAASRWPAIELDELLHRIIVESGVAYAPLIAALRGAP